ncbi:MAG: hypothetical protein ACKVKF_26500 [Rhodobacterales bacterium]
MYLHTCNGWQLSAEGRVRERDMQHATVEPWPGGSDEPETVTLVGPTATHWAASRGRLMWKDAAAPAHSYYGCLIGASQKDIRACWTQERRGGPRRQDRLLQQAERLGLHEDAKLGHYFEILRAAPWSAKLADFAWKLVAGVLPVGRALGCKLPPEYDTTTDRCVVCQAAGSVDCVEHVFGDCPCLRPVRDWTARALEITLDWYQPEGSGAVLHMVYGRSSDTAVDTAVRGVAMDVIRACRAARIQCEHRIANQVKAGLDREQSMQPPTERQLREALRAGLSLVILSDWHAAVSRLEGTRGKGSMDGAHAAKRRPADLTEFDRRWGMVCDRDGGGCQPRPERIDGMG